MATCYEWSREKKVTLGGQKGWVALKKAIRRESKGPGNPKDRIFCLSGQRSLTCTTMSLPLSDVIAYGAAGTPSAMEMLKEYFLAGDAAPATPSPETPAPSPQPRRVAEASAYSFREIRI